MTDTPDIQHTDREIVCVCGHPAQQHFEDACITEITGCSCGDYLPVAGAREEIDRLHGIIRARQTLPSGLVRQIRTTANADFSTGNGRAVRDFARDLERWIPEAAIDGDQPAEAQADRCVCGDPIQLLNAASAIRDAANALTDPQ